MAYSKVIFNGTTIMDVTQDTVAAENLLSGETATMNNGVRTTGTVAVPTKTSDLTNDSGFITSAQAPVQSVNGQTGTVSITIPTVPSASTTAPSMDGMASYGSGTTWARADHVHPTDTSRQAALVSGANIKTINNESLLGSGNIDIQGGGSATWAAVTPTVMGSTFDGYVMSDGHMCVISNSTSSSYADESGEILDDLPTEAMPIYFTAFDASSSNVLNMAIIGGLLHIENLEVFDPTEPIPAFTIVYPVAST